MRNVLLVKFYRAKKLCRIIIFHCYRNKEKDRTWFPDKFPVFFSVLFNKFNKSPHSSSILGKIPGLFQYVQNSLTFLKHWHLHLIHQLDILFKFWKQLDRHSYRKSLSEMHNFAHWILHSFELFAMGSITGYNCRNKTKNVTRLLFQSQKHMYSFFTKSV